MSDRFVFKKYVETSRKEMKGLKRESQHLIEDKRPRFSWAYYGTIQGHARIYKCENCGNLQELS